MVELVWKLSFHERLLRLSRGCHEADLAALRRRDTTKCLRNVRLEYTYVCSSHREFDTISCFADVTLANVHTSVLFFNLQKDFFCGTNEAIQ